MGPYIILQYECVRNDESLLRMVFPHLGFITPSHVTMTESSVLVHASGTSITCFERLLMPNLEKFLINGLLILQC